MRRVSKGAWLAIGLALVASALCVATLGRLASAPPVVHTLAPTRDDVHRRLAIAGTDGVLVVESDAAYHVDRNLQRHDLAWPMALHIDYITSITHHAGGIRAVYVNHGKRGFLYVGAHAVIMDSQETAFAVHGDEFIHREEGVLKRVVDDGAYLEPLPISDRIHGEAVEGMSWIEGKPHLLVGERGAHWLIDFDGQILPMPGGSFSVWSASNTLRSGKMPFLDEHGVTHAYESGTRWLAMSLEPTGELMALAISRGLDESGVLATSLDGRRIELQTRGRRILAATAQKVAWTPVASTSGPYEFAAFPVGDRWMLLNDDGSEAAVLDAGGHLLRGDGTAATVAALSGHDLALWFALIGLLAAFTIALPLVILRTVRGLTLLDETPPRPDQPNARGLFVGTLHVPPGAVLVSGAGGRVRLQGHCQLRAAGATLELASRPHRIDFARAVPLVDGEPVYVVGRVETDEAGGPMRASQRKRIQADDGRYLIGRGDASDFARHLTARENAQLIGFALVHLALALGTLLALRPLA